MDEGLYATRIHCTHLCQSCDCKWKPASPGIGNPLALFTPYIKADLLVLQPPESTPGFKPRPSGTQELPLETSSLLSSIPASPKGEISPPSFTPSIATISLPSFTRNTAGFGLASTQLPTYASPTAFPIPAATLTGNLPALQGGSNHPWGSVEV